MFSDYRGNGACFMNLTSFLLIVQEIKRASPHPRMRTKKISQQSK